MNTESQNSNNLGVLIRCCIAVMGSIGIVANCVGIFYTPLSNALGVGIGQVSAMVMVTSFATATCSYIFPRLKERFPIKRIMTTGVLITAVAYILESLATNIYMIYGAAIVMGIGACFYGMIPISGIIKDWYGEKTGTPLGIVVAMSGIVGAILNPILSRIITTSGYPNAMRLLALIIVLLPLPAILTMPVKEVTQSEKKQSQLTRGPKPSTTSVVLLFITAACFFTQNGINTHVSSIATSAGYSLEFSARAVSGTMIFNTCFKLLFGRLADRLGPFNTVRIFLIIGYVGTFFMMMFRHIPTLMLVGPCLFAANFSCSMIGTNLMAQRVGKDYYTDVYAKMSVLTTLAYATGTTVYGFIRDYFNSYQPVFMIVTTLCILGFIMTIVLENNLKSQSTK